MIYIDLVQNISLLIAMVAIRQILSDSQGLDSPPFKSLLKKYVTGIIYGSMAVIAMMTPAKFATGVIFDSRSIIMITAGLFGGPIVALISASIAIDRKSVV